MRLSLERKLGAYIGIVCALLVLNNSLPYLGLRDDSCQTMFSGLDYGADWNNHAFLPQRPLGDRWQYLRGVRAEIDPRPASARATSLASWLDAPDRRLNVDAVRAVVSQLCGAGHRVRLEYHDGERARSIANACTSATLSTPSWWIPVRLYEPDLPLERR